MTRDGRVRCLPWSPRRACPRHQSPAGRAPGPPTDQGPDLVGRSRGRAAYRPQQCSSALTARISLTSPDSHRTMLGDRGRSDVRTFLSPTEATVAGIWAELLEQGDIGPEDDFFELGGDSLLAVWLMEEIAERTGRRPTAVTPPRRCDHPAFGKCARRSGSTTWHVEGDQRSWNAMSALLDPWVG